MIEAILFIASIVGTAVVSYLCGKMDSKTEATVLTGKLVTEKAVRHNLNCLVGDLRQELKDNKADALAYNAVKGQWATDDKRLVERNTRKECFRRIGFPEQRL